MKKIKEIVQEDSNRAKEEGYTGYLHDVIRMGCISGMVTDLIYYEETTDFYNAHEEEIWDTLRDVSEDMGYTSLTYLDTLGGGEIDSPVQLKNTLSWFAYENAAQSIIDEEER